jgi:hypothetical protein
MVDVHPYLPPIEPRAQRPLWVLVIMGAAIIAGGLLATWPGWPGRWDGDPIRYQALVEAAGLFEEGLTKAALSELDAPVLQHSAEASLLRGVIAFYEPDSKAEEAQRWLEPAAEGGAPGADTLFGFLLLQKGCTSYAKKAAHWFEHALARRADRNARLGLAIALTRQRYAPHLLRAQVDALLTEDGRDTVRLAALTLRGSLDEGQYTATAYTEEAANQGFAYAQYRLATRYLPYGHQAQLWLAMAALQGDHNAVGRLGISPDPSIMREAEQQLLALAADPQTELGKAAAWCAGRFIQDPSREKTCRLKALESRMGCELPATVIETLGMHELEHSEAYDRCRTKALND